MACVPLLLETLFFSVGDDKVIKQWSMEQSFDISLESSQTPLNTIIGKNLYHGIDHNWNSDDFATCGEQVDIWNENRADPIRSFNWGVDTIHSIKFNPIETHLLASTASDRSIILYDMRGSAPLRKVVMEMRSNTVAWNPLEALSSPQPMRIQICTRTTYAGSKSQLTCTWITCLPSST